MLFAILVACSFISIYWLSISIIELGKAGLGVPMARMMFATLILTAVLLAYARELTNNSFICY